MFRRARLRLTLWYSLAMFGLFLAVGLSAFFILRQRLDDEIDQSLQNGLSLLAAGNAFGGGSFGGQGRGGGRLTGDDVRTDQTGDEALALGLSTDIFTVWLAKDGSVTANPRRIDLSALPLSDLAGRAAGGQYIANVDAESSSFRVAIGPTGGRNGDTSAFVLVGRSLDARNAQLKALALVFGLGTLVALAAAAAGGFWLAGRALTPIRLTDRKSVV